MTYLQQVDAWLTDQLTSLGLEKEPDEVKHRILQKIVESYRNGQRACPKCNPRPPKRQASE